MAHDMVAAEKFTSVDLAYFPDDGKRYEIIDGELFVSKQPRSEHQYTCNRLGYVLEQWNESNDLGIVLPAPGLVFGEHDDVVPDVIWISHGRYEQVIDDAGHLSAAPELVIEVLSPGKANEYRDRQAKLDLYSRRGVEEYWIVSWIQRLVEVYRREGVVLQLITTLHETDTLESPLLPGFSCQVSRLFFQYSSAQRDKSRG